MWWQYTIVALIVGGCAAYLLRGLVRMLRGKGAATCAGCGCGGMRESPPRLGQKKELVQLGIDNPGRRTGA